MVIIQTWAFCFLHLLCMHLCNLLQLTWHILYWCLQFFLQPSVIQPSDNQLCLADFEAVKVIGKGNGGIVRLVQHKWTGQFFALKVYVATISILLIMVVGDSFD